MTKPFLTLALLLAIFHGFTWNSRAQISTSLQQTTFDTCGANIPSILELGNVSLAETLATDLSMGTYTFFIVAPSNYEINATGATFTGTDITNAVVAQSAGDATRLEVTLTVAAESSLDVLTFENVTLTRVSGTTTNGILAYDLSGNPNNINGPVDGSTLATLTFNALYGGDGVDQAVCATAAAQAISIAGATITQSRTYEWQQEIGGTWTPIANSNAEELAIAAAPITNGINRFRRRTTFTLNAEVCTLTSTVATITVNEIYPGSITEGTGQNLCATEIPDQLSTAGDVAVTVGGTATYQWYKNDTGTWEVINGANNTFYQPSALTVTTAFKRRITNTFNGFTCFSETPPVTITINAAVAGGTIADQTVCTLDDLQLLTVDNGANGTYQWQRNNVGTWEDIPNATSVSFDARNAIVPGINEFRRVTTVSGASCQGASTVATIAYANFTVGSIGGAQTICNGDTPNAINTVTNATGTGTISYQWQQFNGLVWTPIAGATGVSFQPGALQQTTSFRRVDGIALNGNTCSEPTNEVVINVNGTVLGGTTTDQNICSLGDLQLVIINNGENNGSYQWQRNVGGLWDNIPNETGSNLNTSTHITPGVNQYRRITTISGAGCEGISTVATITYTNFAVGSISGDQTLCFNDVSAPLISETDATGSGAIRYQWQRFEGGGWVAISGAEGPALQPGALQQTTRFRRMDAIELNNHTCSAFTNEITINVLEEVLGGDVSPNQTLCAGEDPAPLTVVNGSTAGANISFQWQSRTSGNFTNMPGETDANLSFATAPAVSTTYRRQTLVSNNARVCTAFSSESTVFVNTIIPGIIGTDQAICAGEIPATLLGLSNTSAPGSVSYQWEWSTDAGTNWSPISGATGTTHTPGILATTTSFRRWDTSVLNGITCSAQTNEITIAVAGAINGGDGSAPQTVCEAEPPATLTVANGTQAGVGISFQWYASTDDITYAPIAGESGESLSFATGIAASTYFTREVTLDTNGTICTARSTPTLVTLLSLSAGSIGQTQTVCGGEPIPPLTSTTDAVSNGNITYAWQTSLDGDNWTNVAGAVQATFAPPLTDDTETFYRRQATATLQGATCETVTEPVIVYVNRFDDAVNHRITFSNGSTVPFEICNQADPAAFQTNFNLLASGDLSYQWEVSSDNISFVAIPGATNALYDAPAVTADVYYRRRTTSTLNGLVCTTISNTLQFIDAGIAFGGTIATTNGNSGNPSLEVICRGTVPSPMIEASAAFGGSLSYQWFANGSAIPGATGLDFTPSTSIQQTTEFVRTTFSVDIDGNVCAVDSNTITVRVPHGDAIGNDITLCTGETTPVLGDVNLIEGLSFLTFQWYDSNDGSTFAAISGATGPTYAPNEVLVADKYYRRGYIATVDGVQCGPERFSNTLQFFINDVDGGTISEAQQICYGEDPALLNSVADGTARGVLTYQWYASEDNGNTWDIIVGAVNSTYDPEAGNFPTRQFKRTAISTLNGVACTMDSNSIIVAVAEEIEPGILSTDQTLCEGDAPNALTVTGGSTFGDQSIMWYESVDGVVWNQTLVTDASYTPPVPTRTMYYKRRITRTSLNNLTCFVETNVVQITLNHVNAGAITGNQAVCQGSQPVALVEVNGATGAGQLTYQWWSSPDNQTYAEVSGANQPNFLPPTTLTTSTYFKRVVTSSLNGVACSAETAPVLVTVIPYPIIDNDAILANDITDVSCAGGTDGSIIIPNGRITGGNTAQGQINTVTLFGAPELNSTYTLIIDGILYEHQVTLNIPLNQVQTNAEIVQALVQEINSATGARLSPVIASANGNELILTAKVEGIGFTAFASTNSASNAGANSVITQENRVGNTYEWVKIGDPSFTASTLSISNVSAGVYFLTVYNEFCGVTSAPFQITEPNLLTLEIADTCNTALTANSTGGIAPFTFTLTRPDGSTDVSTSNNPSITYTGLTGGAMYTVSVQGSSCAIPVSESVTLPLGLQFNAASVRVENVSCFGQNDGSISLNNGATTVTGGTPSYNFVWTGPDNVTYTTQNISNLAPGVYVLNVTDQIGCSATFTANIASKSLLEIQNVQVTNQQLQCAGDNNAEIGIQIASDPNAQVQINWFRNGTSFAANSTQLTNLGAGSYEVVVTDGNSDPNAPCTARQTIVITAPPVFTATETVTSTVQCYDVDAQRRFAFTVNGGTAPYAYSVDGGTPISFTTAQATLTGLSNEGHVITVTDANQCAITTFNMPPLTPIAYAGPTAFVIEACENSYPFQLEEGWVSGGRPFLDTSGQPYYLYEWRGPNSFIAQDITELNAEEGSYFLTIIDRDNCESAEIEFVFSPTYEPLTVSRTLTPVSCGADDDGAISIEISGGNRPYTIVWEQEVPGTSSNPNPTFAPLGQNTLQLIGLSEGRIRLTVTSSIPGCTDTHSAYRYQQLFTINKAESLRLVDGPYYDDALCSGSPGTMSVTVFDAQNGVLSFYYEGALVPAVETTANTYALQIADPVENATLSVVNDLGCGFTAPLSTTIGEPSFSYSSTEFELTGLLLTKEDVRFLNTSTTDLAYATWDFGDGSPMVTVVPETDGTLTTHTYDFPGVFDVTLQIFNAQGCSQSIVQTVQIGSGYDVMFPNVFSPNGDGINDYFQGEFTGLSSFTFMIYDMWGSLVFSTAHDFDGLPLNWGWDGTYGNGKPYENISFRYVFVGTTGSNKQITKTGEATILR
jgi:trimeric autotransporter adhesin